MKPLRLALLLLLALPGTAFAGSATIVSRDVPLSGARVLAGAGAPSRFDLVGLHWQGAGAVSFRTRSDAGRWSAWRPAAPEPEDLPGPREAVATRGWRVGNPYWTGVSNRIEYRTRGPVRRLRAYFVWSPVERRAARTLSVAGSPAIVPRSGWQANESIRRAAPLYASAVHFALVHHTAGTNAYGPGASAAIVRGIEIYHVEGNGWNDIGYNFLVDRYGQVFEGRYGGITRNVVGAHAQGFNTGSVGVAVIGDYTSTGITPAARASLVRLLAWRLDLAHVDPLSTLTWLSQGNPRFRAGAPVFLRAVSGHRDTGFTDCPGNTLYAQLGSIAQAVAQTGLPKLYAPIVRGGPGGPVRFTARLSSSLPWTVTVTDALGTVVATGAGTGRAVDWTWDATGMRRGRYTYAIASSASLRPATGTIGSGGAPPPPAPAPPAAPPLALTSPVAAPSLLAPPADGQSVSTHVSYTLSAAATVTATVLGPDGAALATLFSAPEPAGGNGFDWTITGLPAGTYTVVLDAVSAAGASVSQSIPVVLDATVSGFAASLPVFSPNGDGRDDTVDFTFTLAAPVEARLRILTADGKWVATVFDGQLQAGAQDLAWDGSKRTGKLLDGSYQAELSVTDAAGVSSQSVPFASDTKAPRLRLLSLAATRFSLGEPAVVTVKVNGKRIVEAEQAGSFRVPFRGKARVVKAVARDAAGNLGTLRPR